MKFGSIAKGWGASLASAAVLAATPLNAQGASDDALGPPDAVKVPIAMLVDLSSGQTLFARNVDRRFAPASITKVMTAYTAFDLIDRGKLSLQKRVPYNPAAYAEWWHKGSTMFLPHGANPTVAQLLSGITTVSANDGAVVLAQGVGGSVPGWTRLMNANARRLGMRNSHFATPNGWPDEGQTFVTARDLVTLGTALVERHPRLFSEFIGKPGMQTGQFRQHNHDPILGVVKGADGIKTGFTYQAGYGFLGTAKRGDRRLMMVVANAAHWQDRNAGARKFMEWGFQHFNSEKLFDATTTVATAQVQDGRRETVGLRPEHAVRIAFARSSRPDIDIRVRYEGPLQAPVKAGEPVGWMTVKVQGMPPARVPLVATTAVAEAGVLRRIGNSFGALFAR